MENYLEEVGHTVHCPEGPSKLEEIRPTVPSGPVTHRKSMTQWCIFAANQVTHFCALFNIQVTPYPHRDRCIPYSREYNYPSIRSTPQI